MSDDTMVEKASWSMTVLFLVGCVLPLVGFVWGPGSWWAYGLWLAVGAGAVLAFDRHERR